MSADTIASSSTVAKWHSFLQKPILMKTVVDDRGFYLRRRFHHQGLLHCSGALLSDYREDLRWQYLPEPVLFCKE